MERRGRVSAGSRQQDAQRRSTASRKKNRHLEERGLMKEASCGCTLLAELAPPTSHVLLQHCLFLSDSTHLSATDTLVSSCRTNTSCCVLSLPSLVDESLWREADGAVLVVVPCCAESLVLFHLDENLVQTHRAMLFLFAAFLTLLLPLFLSSCSSHPEQDIPFVVFAPLSKHKTCRVSSQHMLFSFSSSSPSKTNQTGTPRQPSSSSPLPTPLPELPSHPTETEQTALVCFQSKDRMMF